MCLTEEKREEHEQFVQSAVKKQQRNKRKREPNMYVAAVLECTVRRVCSEVCSSYFCLFAFKEEETQHIRRTYNNWKGLGENRIC